MKILTALLTLFLDFCTIIGLLIVVSVLGLWINISLRTEPPIKGSIINIETSNTNAPSDTLKEQAERRFPDEDYYSY